MPAKKTADAPAKAGALVRKVKARPARFDTLGAKSAEVDGHNGLRVTRGYRVNDDRKDADEHLVIVNGDREVGVLMGAIGQAIIDGVITRAEVEECLSLAK